MEHLNAISPSPVHTVSISQLLTPQFVGGKIALPVAHFSPFTSLEHVEGVPAKDGPSVSISKLQVLNSLIDQLIRIKDKRTSQNIQEPTDGLSDSLSDSALDGLIDQAAKKLQHSSTNVPLGTSAAMGVDFGIQTSQTGTVVSFLA